MDYILVISLEYVFVIMSVVLSVILLFMMKERVKTARRTFEVKHPRLYTEYATYLYDCIVRVYKDISFYHLWFLIISVFIGLILPTFIACVGIVVALITAICCMGIDTAVDGCVSVLTKRALSRKHIEELEKTHPSLYTEYAVLMYDFVDSVHEKITSLYLWFLITSVFIGFLLPGCIAIAGVVVTSVTALFCVGLQKGVDDCVSALTKRALARIHLAELTKKVKKSEDPLRME